MPTRRLPLAGPIDIGASLSCVTAHHLTPRRDADQGWWIGRTSAGAVSIHLRRAPGGVEAEAWGPGADEMLERLGELCGATDRPEAFHPPPGPVADLHRRRPGLRLGRNGAVFGTLLPVILAQKVTGVAAGRAYAGISRHYGDRAPGPIDGWIAPDAGIVAALRPEDLHPFGVERARAVTVIEAARRVRRLEETRSMAPEDAFRRLTAVRGIGPWTAGHVMAMALGDLDAVPVGDFHLPNTVTWALAGEPRGDDTRMLELLEPYRPHRRRAVALLVLSGLHAPRYGPRTTVEDFSRR